MDYKTARSIFEATDTNQNWEPILLSTGKPENFDWDGEKVTSPPKAYAVSVPSQTFSFEELKQLTTIAEQHGVKLFTGPSGARFS